MPLILITTIKSPKGGLSSINFATESENDLFFVPEIFQGYKNETAVCASYKLYSTFVTVLF